MADKTADKTRMLKARLPRGFADRSAADIRATEKMVATIRRVYERYGFEPVETPLVEFTETLGKFLPDQDRPNEGVFSFRDDEDAAGDQGEWLSLRYDLTAPLARYVAENWERLPKPYRSYRQGWVFRNEKPGPGRFRQFMQFDADTVGAASPAADAEMCMMMADTLEALGIPRGQYVIKVNSRKVLDGVMEAIGVTDERQRLTVLRAIDKFDRLGPDGVALLLGGGRKDDSGDFTKGAGLSEDQISSLLDVVFLAERVQGKFDEQGLLPLTSTTLPYTFRLETKSNLERLAELRSAFPTFATFTAGIDDLIAIARSVEDFNQRGEAIAINTSVVRGLEYYTGAVFEAELLAEIPNEKGQPVVFGSVGGGGRYDGLVGRFMKDDVPATGFSIGVSRLQAALSALGKLDGPEASGPVVVLVMDRDRIGDYQKMVADLRRADIPAELYLGTAGMKAQMKYADRRNAPLAIIQGGDEKARGVVQVKDLVAGKKLAGKLADHDAYREARPGQEEVAEADLVEAVNRMLGRGERRP
jgi:histidyl-tRNA synthetase